MRDHGRILEQVRAAAGRAGGGAASPPDRDAALKEICALLHGGVPRYDWVGFYIVDPQKPRELVLGPFVGAPTEHVRIPFGRGVCGQAADRRETVVVQDVTQEANYLSCSVNVKSEIVLPLMKGGAVLGELDIDSHTPRAFTDADRNLLAAVCEIAAGLF
jgi:L-methionine (R)-S-oxide reductase